MPVDTMLNSEEQPQPEPSQSGQDNDTSACSIVIGPKKAIIKRFNSTSQSNNSVFSDDASMKTGSHTQSILAKMSIYDSNISLEDGIVSDISSQSSYSTTSYGSKSDDCNLEQ